MRAILEQQPDVHVLLGSRDPGRGQTAIDMLVSEKGAWAPRVSLLPLDVAKDESVLAARDSVIGSSSPTLYGIVNNAGIGLGSADMSGVVNVNTLGVKRVCDAFMPMLQDSGRIVNVASASGPKFVSECDPARQAFFTDASIEWATLQQLMEDTCALGDDTAGFHALGLDPHNAYGFSKACVTLYTMLLAQENPHLTINACTPGYIETDLTRPTAESRGVAPADMGMKSPEHGTLAILHLLFGAPHGSGHYYGSDAKRSPLDRYRAPGSPEYLGD